MLISRFLGSLLFAAVLAFPVAAQVQPLAPVGATSKRVSLEEGYILGPRDIIEVSVVGRAEYRARVQVQTDGTIQLPYIKTVQAAEKTVLQLRDTVRALLQQGGYYTDPAVSVMVAVYASRYVTVLGEVANPGLLSVEKAYHVSEILAKVGGARAAGADNIILTRTTGERMTLPIEMVASGGPADDPLVNPGDKVYIAAAPSFYIYGQVHASGSYKVEPGMSLRKALARGGGLTDRGSERKVKLFRDGRELDHLNLSMPIKGGDTIVVGERFF